MRLIDADALIRIVQQSAQDAGLHFSDSQKFLRWLRNARTINAVPVVRCKDCKHWGTTDYAIAETERVKCCAYANYMIGANGYCAYGEVKDDD